MNDNGSALVLSGGGARGAYQAGVLYGLLEHGLVPGGPTVFPILVGTSAGSIHATALAAHADSYQHGVTELMEVWTRIQARHVFRTDLFSTLKTAFSWIRDLTFGGLVGGVAPKSLLDPTPLPRLLSRIPFSRIPSQIKAGHLKALAVPATEYFSNESVVFLQGEEGLPTWHKQRVRVELAEIGLQHILASSAIPMFFPTVKLGGYHYGDGCIRNVTPLAPAIRLGANKILAVGVHEKSPLAEDRTPMVADVASTLLNAVMLDGLERDVAHCKRISTSLKTLPQEGFRNVDVLWLSPTEPIAPMARELMNRIPGQIRYLLRGLGGDRSTAELASYLLFHPDFCGRLVQLGRRDVARQKEQLEEFLLGP